jgi:DNA-binding NarL/FixJ family response regulator
MLPFSHIRILIVDDSPLWRTFLIHHLFDAGLTMVYVAYDGVQAVLKARTLQPDVILMDVSLPRKSGIEAAADIRDSVPSAKIVFLSNNPDADVRRAALAAGGCDYVLKSLAGRQLIDAIKFALQILL